MRRHFAFRIPNFGLPNPPSSIRNSQSRLGQSLLEYAVLVSAVAAALIIMSNYTTQAWNAHAESLEVQLNYAITRNAPYTE